MKVVVTGAQGFLGRQVVAGLQRAGGHCVRALDREVDVRDQDALRAVLEKSAPDAVIHLGGISGPMVAVDDPGLVTAVNTTRAINVLSVCAELRCRPRVVYASSVAVLEEPPGSVYATTKTFAEAAAAYYRAQGLEATGVRIGSLYGPGRMTTHVLSDMAQSARDHKTIEYVLRAVEPLVHVDDAARLIVALLSVEHWRRTYCLVQDNIPHAQLADIVAQQVGEAVQIHPVEGQPLTWREKLDGTAVSAATGVPYRVRVEQGTADFVWSLV